MHMSMWMTDCDNWLQAKKTCEVPEEGKMGTQATLRQAADITLFSTARGSLATSSL